MSKVTMPVSGEEIRLTRGLRRVLLVLLTGAPGLSGYPIGHAAGSHRGVYPALARLEREGWVESEWGERTPNGGQRRYYHLTAYGRIRALKLLGLTTDPPTSDSESGD